MKLRNTRENLANNMVIWRTRLEQEGPLDDPRVQKMITDFKCIEILLKNPLMLHVEVDYDFPIRQRKSGSWSPLT